MVVPPGGTLFVSVADRDVQLDEVERFRDLLRKQLPPGTGCVLVCGDVRLWVVDPAIPTACSPLSTPPAVPQT